jgi:hypothetical protein
LEDVTGITNHWAILSPFIFDDPNYTNDLGERVILLGYCCFIPEPTRLQKEKYGWYTYTELQKLQAEEVLNFANEALWRQA